MHMKKMKRKFFKRNRVTILIILIILGYYAYNMYQTDLKLKEYKEAQVELRSEIESLERDINRLADEYAYSQTPEAVEKIAREKLKMVKPNEIIYLIKGEASEGN